MFTNQSWVANKLACQPKERLLEVIIGLGRDVVVLKVLLSVESNGLGLHLSLLDINLVSGEDDGNILADTDQITCEEELADVMCKSNSGNNSRCQFGTFLYVIREVTSNMMMPHRPLI